MRRKQDWKYFWILTLLSNGVTLGGLAGCSPVSFGLLGNSGPGSTDSVVSISNPPATQTLAPQYTENLEPIETLVPAPEPVVVSEPIASPDPSPTVTKPDESVVEIPSPEPEPPAPSIEPVDTMGRKAKRLLQVMARACQIPNRSYPADYVAPTAADIKSRLIGCTNELYPDTATSKAQENSLKRFEDDSNTSFLKQMFGTYWYAPPTTDHFETYFGVDIKDAVYTFCLDSYIQGDLITPEYKKMVIEQDQWLSWLNNKQQQKLWKYYQGIRTQLKSCMK